ncbi:MAG: hypothetical protein IPK97_13395 [Ahniella sp.]|nr:hypothetical protein [Ahniella sp.]
MIRHEEERVLGLLVDRSEFDGARKTVAVTFKPTGMRSAATDVVAAQQALR